MIGMERVALERCEAMEPVKTSTYLSILVDLLPLFFLAFSIFFLRGVKGLRVSFLGKSFFARFINVIISSALGSALAVGCALLLPLLNLPTDPTTMTGIVVFVSVAGVKVLDGILYKKLGVHFLDVSDTGSADAEWTKMSQEERQECMQTWRETHKENDNGS